MRAKEATEKILELMQSFDNAMLVTQVTGDTMRARPMRIAASDEHGDLWFVTKVESGKVPEINRNPNVNVTMQGGGKFLSISGLARLVFDQERVSELWQEPWRVYFPEGPQSADLALIHVTAQVGEFWDYSGVAEKLRFLFEAGKAYVNEEEIDEEALEHEKVLLTNM